MKKEYKGMKFLLRALRHFFGRVFHTRSIIIISPHRTNHLSLSAGMQMLTMVGVVACVGWASYSTGSYMAARERLVQSDQTIKSVANARVETNLNYMMGNLEPQKFAPVANAYATPMLDPAYSVGAVDSNRLYARIALLENKVKELRTANADIIHTVREKTHNKILDMESIIRSTGLNIDTLKQEAVRQRKARGQDAQTVGSSETADAAGGAGGPFIPAGMSNTTAFSRELEGKLDQLMLLNDIVGALPLRRPVENASQQSGFGRRADPFNGRPAFHAGLDLAAPAGALVRATAPGKVEAAGWNGAYGNAVDIGHGLGLSTRYGHLSAIRVHEGEMVKPGQVIGVQGSTGRSTGPHVHYEVRYKDKPVNPLSFLNAGVNVSEIN